MAEEEVEHTEIPVLEGQIKLELEGDDDGVESSPDSAEASEKKAE